MKYLILFLIILTSCTGSLPTEQDTVYDLNYFGYEKDVVIWESHEPFYATEISGKFSHGNVMTDDFSFVFYGETIFCTPRVEAGVDVRFLFPINAEIYKVRLFVWGITDGKPISLEATLR